MLAAHPHGSAHDHRRSAPAVASPQGSHRHLHLTPPARSRTDAQLTADRAGTITHGDEPKTAPRDGGIEAAAPIADPQPHQRTVALQPKRYFRGAAMAGSVGDGFTGDPHDRLGPGRRQLYAGNEIKFEVDPKPFRDLGCRFS